MKLTIDTKEDSKEEIQKAISMLSALVGENHIYTNKPKAAVANIFESSSNTIGNSEPSSEPVSAFASMFGDASSVPVVQPAEETEEVKPKKVELIPY